MSHRKPHLPRPPLDPRLTALHTTVFGEIERRRLQRLLRRHIITLQVFSVIAAFAVGVLCGEASALNNVWGW